MVKYFDLDYTVRNSLHWINELRIRNSGTENEHLVKSSIFYFKTDFRSAFRVLPLKISSWPYLIIKARDPISNQTYYFVDKCLPFRASISCSHF